MPVSNTVVGPNFRAPLNAAKPIPIPPSSFHAPLEELFSGDWFMIRSSNAFWKDKRNVRLNYTPLSNHIDDRAYYQTMTSDVVKSMDGKDTPLDSAIGIYTWQGKGLLKIASARWEVLSFTSRPETGDWMLVFAHKSIFTSPAVNVMCRNRGGLCESDLQSLEAWIPSVEDASFQQAARGLFNVKQDE